MKLIPRILCALALLPSVGQTAETECTNWRTAHPQWIWCDDFESDSTLTASYFEVNRAGGRFGVQTAEAFGGSGALRAKYEPGVEEYGNVKLGVGRSPVATNVIPTEDVQSIYWRFYTKVSPNWVGNPRKVTRATIFTSSTWAQAAISHLWENAVDGTAMGLDPVSGVVGNTVVTTKYNDAANLKWLGKGNGVTPVYAPENRDRWFCVEMYMKLNTPGVADGVAAFWVDSRLESERTNLNWRGSYTGYGINAIMLENFKNEGATQVQYRYYDNFVVSRQRIGCGPSVRPNPPTDVASR